MPMSERPLGRLVSRRKRASRLKSRSGGREHPKELLVAFESRFPNPFEAELEELKDRYAQMQVGH